MTSENSHDGRVRSLSVAFFTPKVACFQKFNKRNKQEASWRTRQKYFMICWQDMLLWFTEAECEIWVLFFNQRLGLHFYGDARWPFIASTSPTDERKTEFNQTQISPLPVSIKWTYWLPTDSSFIDLVSSSGFASPKHLKRCVRVASNKTLLPKFIRCLTSERP